MSVFNTIRNLKSFRSASEDLVERKSIGKILEAGRQAPSPGNVQSLEFIVVEDDDQRRILAEATGDKRFDDAPTSVIVVSDIDRMARKVGNESANDASMAEASASVQNMRLTAKELGISSAWVTGFDKGMVSDNFGIPSSKPPMALLALCYADSEYDKPDRFGLNSVAYYNKYDNQIRSVFDQLEWKGVRQMRERTEKDRKSASKRIRERLQKYL